MSWSSKVVPSCTDFVKLQSVFLGDLSLNHFKRQSLFVSIYYYKTSINHSVHFGNFVRSELFVQQHLQRVKLDRRVA